METVFAPFGNSERFFKEGNTSSLEAPFYLKKLGLNGYEYSCEEGVHISDDGCETLKKEAAANKIFLSLYAGNPGKLYNISSDDEKVRKKAVMYLADCITTAKKLNCSRVIVPLGSCAVTSRSIAAKHSVKSMNEALIISEEIMGGDIFICPELMGKVHDFGTFEEILKLSRCNEYFIPAINFPNLFSRLRKINTDYETILKLLSEIERIIGKEKAKIIHIYISKFCFTNQGLKKYTDLSDNNDVDFNYKAILNAIKIMKMTPFIVCRSPIYCDTDALHMKKYFDASEEKLYENTFFKRTKS